MINWVIMMGLLLFPTSLMAKTINAEKSTIKWQGKGLFKTHSGNLVFKSAEGKFDDKGNLISGIFVVDMRSMTVDPKSVAVGAKKLLDHLKSDDFFNVENYRTSTFVLEGVTGAKGKGQLSIKDLTHPAMVTLIQTPSGYDWHLVFDRTKWSIKYGSKKFFKQIGDRFIEDRVTVRGTLIVE